MTALPDTGIDRIVAAHQVAVDFYRSQLLDSPAAARYLRSRGIVAASAPDAPWMLGYAPAVRPGVPASWTALRDHLRSAGFTDRELLDAGLITTARNGNRIDVFRDRVMFPVRDADGNTVAFTGRDLSGRPGVPKYRNTTGTRAYHKSEVLYGLHEQLAAGIAPAALLVVEGPADVVALAGAARAGRRPPDRSVAVAPCGTALTAQHVTLLAAEVPRGTPLVLAFDADAAGFAALDKAHELITDWPGPVDAVLLPDGDDPAALVARDGPTTARAVLHDRRRPAHDAVLDVRLKPHLARLAERAREISAAGRDPRFELRLHALGVVRAVAPLLADAVRADPQHGTHLLFQVADRLQLDPITVTEAVYHLPDDIDPDDPAAGPEPTGPAAVPLGTRGFPDPAVVGHEYARTPGSTATWVAHDPRTCHAAWVLAEPVGDHPADHEAARLAAELAGRAAILVGAHAAIDIARRAINTHFAAPGTAQGNATIAVVCSFDGDRPRPGTGRFTIAWAGDIRVYGAALVPHAAALTDPAPHRDWFAALTTDHRSTPSTPVDAPEARRGRPRPTNGRPTAASSAVLTASVRGGSIGVNTVDIPLRGIVIAGRRVAALPARRLRTAIHPYRPAATATALTELAGAGAAALVIKPRPEQVRELLTSAALARQDRAATTTSPAADPPSPPPTAPSRLALPAAAPARRSP